MGKFLLKRIILVFFVLWAVATMVFFLVHVTPGDVAEAILVQTRGPESISDESLAQIRQKFDLDQPVIAQYFSWLLNVFQGDSTQYYSARNECAFYFACGWHSLRDS